MPDVEQLLEYIRRNGRWQSEFSLLTIWRVHRHSSTAMKKLTLRPIITKPRPRGILASLFSSSFLLLLLLLPIPLAEQRAYSASPPMSVRHPERARLCIPSFPSFLPLVNLLINNDCKPDNAVFAIFILLPLSLHATPSTLSLYTYVYIYSIDFHSKTTFTSRSKIAHYPFRLNSPNSSAFRQNKENL